MAKKTKIKACVICRKNFVTSYSGGVYDVNQKGGEKL